MNDGFVSAGKVSSYVVNGVPKDITAIIRTVAPSAVPRMLTRFDDAAEGSPVFSSCASTCTHRGCPILTGDDTWGTADQPIYNPANHVVTCPCHSSQFNVGTGAVIMGPAKLPLITFATEIRNDEVFVAIAAGAVMPLTPISPFVADANNTSPGMAFPGSGKKYLVDFGAFVVELFFEDESTLTYTGIRRDGGRGASETVTIQTSYLRDDLFMVTWQEADLTTVVHIEDFEQSVIYTNITNPDRSFMKFRGTFAQIR